MTLSLRFKFKKLESTFSRFSKSLCNSSVNSLFDMFPFLIPLPEADLSASKADYLSKTL